MSQHTKSWQASLKIRGCTPTGRGYQRTSDAPPSQTERARGQPSSRQPSATVSPNSAGGSCGAEEVATLPELRSAIERLSSLKRGENATIKILECRIGDGQVFTIDPGATAKNGAAKIVIEGMDMGRRSSYVPGEGSAKTYLDLNVQLTASNREASDQGSELEVEMRKLTVLWDSTGSRTPR